MNKDKDLDDLFKRKIGDPVDETKYNEADWDAFEQMLDQRKKRGVIYRLPLYGSVAALLLLGFGYWFFGVKHATVNGSTGGQPVAVQKPAQPGTNSGTAA